MDKESWCWDMNVAAQLGDVQTLQQANPADLVSLNKRGWSPVMYASARGHRDLLLTLLELALQGDLGEEARRQALNTAVHCDDLTTIAFLIERGTMNNVALNEGLLQSIALGHTRVAQFLLESGADVNFTNNDALWSSRDAEGATPLAMATQLGDAELTCMLVTATVQAASRGARHNQLENAECQNIGVSAFCNKLTLSLDKYEPEETLHQFLCAVGLEHLWPTFQREEVDFGVFLGMADQDLQLVGITGAETRRAISEERAYVVSYFEQLFGPNMAAKLFKHERGAKQDIINL